VRHNIGKIVGVHLYRNDLVVIREGTAPDTNDATRGEITEFSKKSRLRLAFVASNTPVVFRTMITLTYPKVYPTDGKAVKDHLGAFLAWVRKDRGACEYLWFLEFQARGAPHIHLMYDFHIGRHHDTRTAFRFRCSASWYNIVSSGDEKHLAAGTRCEALRKYDGAARYAIKYAHKMRQKAVPPDYQNVGRFWGYSQGVKPQPEAEFQCTEDDLRALVEDWEYAPDSDHPLYRVLYNQADRLRAHLAGGLDKASERCYTGPQDQ